jgi:Zn-dependent protease with chaperone function
MHHPPRTSLTFAFTLVGAALLLAAAPTGDVWREPTKFPPSTAPTSLALASRGAKKGKGTISEVEVLVKDGAGQPMPGLAIHVSARWKKDHIRQDGATDATGKLVISAPGAVVITFTFQGDGGAKTVDARLEPDGKGWKVAAAPYTRISDRAEAGSCKNLFHLAPAGATGKYRLEYRYPASLFECEEIDYGSDKKVIDLVKINAIGSRDINRGDKNNYTEGDEEKLGLEASAQMDQQYVTIKDPEIVGYVQQLMEKVIAASDAPRMPLHLRVVQTDDVNAFVTVGGHVYVFTGLFKLATNESQIAGVLAHETSHAIAHHVTEGATRAQAAQTGTQIGSQVLGALLGLGQETQGLMTQGATQATGMVLLKYDRASETEADLLGTQYLWKAGWDPEGIARFFELIAKTTPKGSAGPAWLSTHPTHEKRIENGIQWAQAFLPAKERYLVDTAAFQRVKAKIMKLAPPATSPAPKQGMIQPREGSPDVSDERGLQPGAAGSHGAGR